MTEALVIDWDVDFLDNTTLLCHKEELHESLHRYS